MTQKELELLRALLTLGRIVKHQNEALAHLTRDNEAVRPATQLARSEERKLQGIFRALAALYEEDADAPGE